MNLNSNPYATRSQVIMLLLAIMNDLKGGHSKQRVIDEIEAKSWFARLPEDSKPYPTVTKEARWKTLVAFTRKDCYEDELFIQDGIPDSWQISKLGNQSYILLRDRFAGGELDCRKCYMWSSSFKSFIDPRYIESSDDAKRPSDVYKDYHKRDMRIESLRLARLLMDE